MLVVHADGSVDIVQSFRPRFDAPLQSPESPAGRQAAKRFLRANNSENQSEQHLALILSEPDGVRAGRAVPVEPPTLARKSKPADPQLQSTGEYKGIMCRRHKIAGQIGESPVGAASRNERL